jgi:hypothetical protein
MNHFALLGVFYFFDRTTIFSRVEITARVSSVARVSFLRFDVIRRSKTLKPYFSKDLGFLAQYVRESYVRLPSYRIPSFGET